MNQVVLARRLKSSFENLFWLCTTALLMMMTASGLNINLFTGKITATQFAKQLAIAIALELGGSFSSLYYAITLVLSKGLAAYGGDWWGLALNLVDPIVQFIPGIGMAAKVLWFLAKNATLF